MSLLLLFIVMLFVENDAKAKEQEKKHQQRIYESFRSDPFEEIVARSEANVILRIYSTYFEPHWIQLIIIIIIETFVTRLLQLKNEHKRYICYIKIDKKIRTSNNQCFNVTK